MRYATIVHDLNDIFTTIHGNIFLILSNPNLDHECRQRLEDIRECIEKGASLTRQIPSEQKNNAILPEKKNELIGIKGINEIIEGQVQLYRSIFESHHIKAHLNYGKDHSLAVNLSKWEAGQISLNLLATAFRAMPEGGDLYIDTETKSCKSTSTQKPHIKISARNTGSGMDDVVMKRILERYFTTKQTGRGLGLVSIIEIVSRCEGKIMVKSKPWIETTFAVCLPAQAAKT